MNVLIIGSGGREHAITWKVAQSPKLTKLFIAPGNPGTDFFGENINVKLDDHPAIVRLCQENKIDLVIVGPETPLANGLADVLSASGVKVFGPNKAAAQIEASKSFSKQFMARHGIPTARFAIFTKLEEAVAHLDSIDYPVVIKASGLAAGKGVILPSNRDEAVAALKSMLVEQEFGAAGAEVIIEERLSGPEVSLMAFTDGKTVVPMVSAQDHKRLRDGDEGPNTGGMGAYAPAPIFTPDLLDEAVESVLKPAVSGLRLEGTPFVGILYAGLILTTDGMRTLEFNCRFGDPETQVVLPLLESDLLEIAEACADGRLKDIDICWKSESAVCVVLASEGYPGKLVYGKLTQGSRQKYENGVCFQAGTRLDGNKVLTAGGRVFGVTAWDTTLEKAVRRAYGIVERIHFDGMQYRKDIAWRALKTETILDETEKQSAITDETEEVDGLNIAEPRGEYETKVVKTPYDDLTYLVSGLAMKVHDELRPGHKEKFYQRRLAELCREAGLQVELEKRVEVWVNDSLVGYLFLDLWINEILVVECKALSHGLTDREVGQVITYLAATGSPIGKLFNFGLSKFEQRRIFPPQCVQDWQQHLARYVWTPPGVNFPVFDAQDSAFPIRFSVTSPASRQVEIPSVSSSVSISVPPLSPLSTSVPASDSPRESAYAASGVSIDAGAEAVELMKDAVKATYSPSVLAGIGSFGGLFDASSLKGMKSPVLVASTDGVGTKVKMAASLERYRGVGHDIVNHCIDDILVQGARPLFFLDYFATSKLNPPQTAEVVSGIAEACQEAGIALLGGETAEMPGVYSPGEFDVAGTIVGVLEREKILPRTAEFKAGNVLLGLRSSGPHTNGYSLIRKVFANTPLSTVFPELGIPLADALLASHRSYLNLLSDALCTDHILGLAHLTGGGFIDNIPRVLPENLNAEIHLGSWDVPPLWSLIQKMGDITIDEMFRVFNMGIGMVVIVDKDSVAEVQKLIPEQTWEIGKLVQGSRKVTLV
jgi:phosphoribosylamine--glycine ligase/phosphoribosylaminoimidazole synthetase